MACEKFNNDYNPHKKSLVLLNYINEIVSRCVELGLHPTVRQIYYQLVARNIIKNDQTNYDAISRLITNGRMGGLVDWDAIEDKNRKTHMHYFNYGVEDAINDSVAQYRLNKMLIQKMYIEVMIEKMALEEIARQVTDKYSIKLTGNRGFCSTSILYATARRFKEARRAGKKCYLLYIGDHDPSGLTMDESLNQTLLDMGANGVALIRVALTKEQVEYYNFASKCRER